MYAIAYTVATYFDLMTTV